MMVCHFKWFYHQNAEIINWPLKRCFTNVYGNAIFFISCTRKVSQWVSSSIFRFWGFWRRHWVSGYRRTCGCTMTVCCWGGYPPCWGYPCWWTSGAPASTSLPISQVTKNYKSVGPVGHVAWKVWEKLLPVLQVVWWVVMKVGGLKFPTWIIYLRMRMTFGYFTFAYFLLQRARYRLCQFLIMLRLKALFLLKKASLQHLRNQIKTKRQFSL